VAAALNNWGVALLEQAEDEARGRGDGLFAAAGEKYAAALRIKPDFHEALNNWGNALSVRRRRRQGSRRKDCSRRRGEIRGGAAHQAGLPRGAQQLGQRALRSGEDEGRGRGGRIVRGGGGEIRGGAGASSRTSTSAQQTGATRFSGQAKTKAGVEAEGLFTAAGEKYAAALRIKPDYHRGAQQLGQRALRSAKTEAGAEADGLFAAAGRNTRRRCAFKPDFHEALNNWGAALLDQAKTKAGAEADGLFAAAGENTRRRCASSRTTTRRSTTGAPCSPIRRGRRQG